jgi:8-oxo-dGTP pyrophosphatase MutT (NUDIX family)
MKGLDAAYRELFEETNISSDNIELHHLMDFTYYDADILLECMPVYLILMSLHTARKMSCAGLTLTATFSI